MWLNQERGVKGRKIPDPSERCSVSLLHIQPTRPSREFLKMEIVIFDAQVGILKNSLPRWASLC